MNNESFGIAVVRCKLCGKWKPVYMNIEEAKKYINDLCMCEVKKC